MTATYDGVNGQMRLGAVVPVPVEAPPISPAPELSPAEARVTAAHILRTIRTLYPPDRWIFLTELRSRTGIGFGLDSERYMDAFVMGLWPSDNFKKIAYEVKVSRADWLAELRQPEKHMAAFMLSNELYIAVAPGVYQADDIYPRDRKGRVVLKGSRSTLLTGAGVIEVAPSGTIRTLHRPVAHTAWPMPEAFIASMVRRAREQERTARR